MNLCSKWSLLATHISLHPAWVDRQCPNLDKLHHHVLASYTNSEDQGRCIHSTCKGARSRLRDFVTAFRPALEDRYG